MRVLIVYAVTLAALISLPRLRHRWPTVFRASSRCGAFCVKHGSLPLVLRRRPLIGPITRLQVLTHVLYGAGTLVANLAHIRNRSDAASRAASLSVLHLVFVLVSVHQSLTADVLSLSRSACHRLFQSMAWMAGIQALVHVTIIIYDKTSSPQSIRFRSGVAVRLSRETTRTSGR